MALAVIVMVAATLAFFAVAAAGWRRPSIHVPSTSALAAQPATPLLEGITAAGLPPADVVANLVVPSGTSVAGSVGDDTPEGMYDRSVRLVVPATVDDAAAFFRSTLADRGWHVRPVTASGSGRLVVATRFSHDSYGWEVGVTVEPGGAAGSRAVLRIFQQNDST